jgi:hypothetical protein
VQPYVNQLLAVADGVAELLNGNQKLSKSILDMAQ